MIAGIVAGQNRAQPVAPEGNSSYLLVYGRESLNDVIYAVDPATGWRFGESVGPAYFAAGAAGRVLTGPALTRYNWPLQAGAGVQIGDQISLQPLAVTATGDRAVVRPTGGGLAYIVSTETGEDLEQISDYADRAWFDITGRYVIIFRRQLDRSLCDTATGTAVSLPWLGGGATAPKFGPTGEFFYAVPASDATYEYPVLEFSVTDPLTPIRAVTPPTYTQSAMVVCVTATRVLYAAGGSATLVEIGTGATVGTIDEWYSEEENWSVSPDGGYVAAHDGASVRIYSLVDGTLVSQFTGEFQQVRCWASINTPI